MALAAGTRLGPYEILAPLGAGGMGEVYRAHDTRLHRDVAIKLLPESFSADRGRLQRFQQEARTIASLDHPNLLAIHDVGEHLGAPYLVSELLEGESLLARLSRGRLPQRRVLDFAVQIANGLAAAHGKGVVHRDLKPENIFIIKDERVKILDFGLAKIATSITNGGSGTSVSQASTLTAMESPTLPGVVLGTVGYMSPEQVRGEAVDHRSDIFSFGAILYEMLAGRQAFRGKTSVEILTAILREEPPGADIPANTARIVRHCLEKSAEARFQSARDIAFDLSTLAEMPSATSKQMGRLTTASPRRALLASASVALALAVIAAGAYWTGMTRSNPSKPIFHQLTFQRGTIERALYVPGGDTVVFSASWGGTPSEIYAVRPDSPVGVRPLGLRADLVLAVSRHGELALLEGLKGSPFGGEGTLTVAPLGGGAARPLLAGTLSADWSPIGDDLAVSRRVEGRFRLEYPIGKTLRETPGYIDFVKFSPDGRKIAFLEHPVTGDVNGSLAVCDLYGRVTVLTERPRGVASLVWAPSGDELWFTTGKAASTAAPWAVTLKGRERPLASVPGPLFVQSVLPNGRAVGIQTIARHMLMVSRAEDPHERDLAWLDWPIGPTFSSDGRQIVFTEQSAATGGNVVFSRSVDGGPAARLGEGWDPQVSPDGKWVVAVVGSAEQQLMVYPTGPGAPRQVTHSKHQFGDPEWFPDSRRIAVSAGERGVWRTFMVDLNGNMTPLTPPGIVGFPLTPDGHGLLTRYPDGSVRLFPVQGGAERIIRGVEDGDSPRRFSSDGKYLFVSVGESATLLKVWRIEMATGRRELYKEIRPPDSAGVTYTAQFPLAPDMRSYAYIYAQRLSVLYEIENMR